MDRSVYDGSDSKNNCGSPYHTWATITSDTKTIAKNGIAKNDGIGRRTVEVIRIEKKTEPLKEKRVRKVEENDKGTRS